MNIIVAIRTTKIKKIIKPDSAPDLPNSKVVTNALGISATIPEKIISDIYRFQYLSVLSVHPTTLKILFLQQL